MKRGPSFLMRISLMLAGVFAVSLALSAPSRAADVNLRSYWALDGNATDSSGYGYHGTLTGGGWSAFHAPTTFANTGSLSLDGSLGQGIQTPLVTTAVNNVSLSAWVNWAGINGSGQMVLYNGDSGPNGYGIYITPGGELSILNGGVAIASPSTPFQLSVGVWQYIVAMRDAGVWKLYVAGIQIPLSGNPAPNIPASGTTIGRAYAVANNTFNGLIDEARIYDRVLAATETCAPAISVTNANDSGAGSLRQAIAGLCAGGTITFGSDYTVLLASELAIGKSLTIDGAGHNVTISGNHATRVFNLTGGTIALNRLTIADGYFDAGYSGDSGAGIRVNGSTLNLTNSTVSGNVTGWPGGGGLELRSGAANVSNSTFTGNSGNYGGGIDTSSSTTLNVSNSTFAGNSAASAGGALSVSGVGNIINSTISGNSAAWVGGGGGINNEDGAVTVSNSIIANNPTGGNCFNHYPEFSVTVGVNSLANDNSCGVGFTNSASILLGALGNYGGSTQTFALLPGSSAIDAGDDAICAASPVNNLDQRGVARLQGAHCDVGAYESRGFTLAQLNGDNQSAPVNTAFANPLALSVTSAYTEPVNGGQVTFVGPLTGAGTSPITNTATIISGGVALTLTANSTAGGPYTVATSAAGAANIVFSLSNTAPCESNITVTNNADSGAGSLRDAIGLACPGGTIDFDDDYMIGLETSQLVIDKTLTIDGTGHDVSVDAQSSSRVLYVNAGVTFTLRHVAVTNGSALNGGGLYNNGATVILRDAQISQNFASQYGGGIYSNGGYLDIDPTTIISNSAALSGGGLYNHGGTLVISDTAFINNTANGDWPNGNGGGLYSFQGVVTLSRTQFLTNTAYLNGGGAYLGFEGFGRSASPNAITADPDTTEIYASLFQGNSVDWGNGGGLYNAQTATTLMSGTIVTGNSTQCGGNCFGGGLYNSGYLAIDGLTITDNRATGGEGGGYGGGLYTGYGSRLIVSNSVVAGNSVASSLATSLGGGLALEGTTQITNTTISGNVADDGGGVYYVGTNAFNHVTLAANTGGGIWTDSQSVSAFDLQNSIIADNHTGSGDAQDCAASLNSLGYNLIETIDGCTLTGDMTGVITGVDPQLGPLQDNGGSTWTMALLPDSPALEAGNLATCAATDQRGVARPQGAACDLGAYEAQALFAKAADVAVAQAGQRATYTLSVLAQAPIVNGVISDTLPADVTLAGPITLSPVGAGTIGTPPALVTGINLGTGEWLTITIPVTVNVGVANGAFITNTATLTGDGLLPLSASASFEVDTFDLSGSIKRVDRSTAMLGDILSYTITLTNTALYKTGAFTVTDWLPAYTNYIAGSASATVGSTVFMGSPSGGAVIWTGTLSGTMGESGYVYGDSLGNGVLSGVSYNWIDISATGTPISFPTSQDDDYFYPIALPFPVTFYGVDYANLAVATNGTVYFEDALLSFGNGPIPADTGDGVNTFIAAYWDDLEVTPGAVYYEVQGTAPHRRVVIQYDQVSLCCTSAEPGTWEIILYEDRPDVVLQYQDVFFNSTGGDYGGTATVGVQNSVTEGVQYSVDTPALSDGLAIVFAPPPAQNAVAELTFKAIVTTPAPNGTWITNTAVVQDNYGDEWSLSAATLLGTPADVSIAKTVTPTVAQPGQTITYTLAVSNTGGQTASGVVLTDELPISLTGVTVQSAGIVITQTGGIPYVWQVADLAPGASGIITLTGVISPDIQGVAGFTNTVTISAVADGNLADNTSSAWVTLLYNLTVATVGNGTVAPTTSTYLYGTLVPITATANVGSSFVGWSGDLSGSINPTSILIDGDKTVTATFALNTYTLTVATVGDGTVSPTTSSYLYGTVVPLTATANVGSSFVGWSGDLSGNTNPTAITIDGDKFVTATFALNTYTLTVATVGDGTVSPTTSSYLYGTVVPLTATANVGSSFVGWSGDLSGNTNPTTILIDGDKFVTATFALNTYTLTVATVGDGTVSPTTSSYLYGTVVPLTATANVGSSFVGWSGDLSGNANPTSILIDGNKSITATFALNTYTLTVATVGDGAVAPATSTYPYGTVVPVTATANVGSAFISWSGDLSGSVNPTSILIDGDKSITATFALNTYTLTVATVGNGTVAPTTNAYPYGTLVPITATAGVGSAFVGWSGDLSGSTNPTAITIDGDKFVTATFALNTYTLTVATVGDGTVSPTTSSYLYGTVVPLTATANVGSSFVGWSGDLSGSTNPTAITIDGDKFVTATFALNTYTLTVATVGDGTVSPTTSSYLYGTVVPLTATANVGSSFVGWSGDLSGNTNPTAITIDGDKFVTATFALNTYTLTVATVGDGTVSPTTSSYLYGTVVPLTATANVGSSFVGWSGDLSGSTNPTAITIDGDKFVTATFALNTYTLTVATVGDGTVSPTTSSYFYGTVVPLTATANVGSSFVGWSGDLSGSTNPTAITIDGDKFVTATFSSNAYTLVVNVVGPGSVSPITGAYIYGTVVPVTATANGNAAFVGWSGDLSGSTNPTSILIDGDKTITATFEQVEFVTYLPLIAHNAARLPDLIVQSVAASSDVITVVIKNIGDAPAFEAFWVDAYINPTPPPTAVNEIWWDLDRSHEGVAWGVVEPIVPIMPGTVITLTSNGDYVSPDRTYFTGNLPVGTPIYAQVDTYNAATNYGAVLERHEHFHETYNNILGPIYSSAGTSGALGRFQPIGPQLNPALPYRPVRP